MQICTVCAFISVIELPRIPAYYPKVSFRYVDWTGKKTQKLKRGFKTKKEALNYEKEFIRKTAADMKMEMNSFIQIYFE